MTWNHRVIRRDDGTLGIHEVFYNDEGEPEFVTEEEVGIIGDNIEDIEREIARFLVATTKPILDMEVFSGEAAG